MNTIATWGDRLLNKVVPKQAAAACDKTQYCSFRYKGCGGPYCYYYFQSYGYCKAYSTTTCGVGLVSSRLGCC
jgi:hypothetical protein